MPPESKLLSPRPSRPRSPARRPLLERNCSVGRTVDIIGDGWSFMILRECYFGIRRFQHFQSMLGLPRETLSSRLRRLTEWGLLRRVLYQERPSRYEYRLTKMGFELYPVMIALLSFGDKWLAGAEPPPLKLLHVPCGHESHPLVACAACREPVRPWDVTYRPGPGAGTTPVDLTYRSRRNADPTALERRRPSSVARALKIIGDRWSFKVIRETWYGARRFDQVQESLGIASNILADRLNRFVRLGALHKVKYQNSPDRYEYRLTEMGNDLYGPFLAMLRWGDDWLSNGQPPLLLTHVACGHDLRPLLICDHCRNEIKASDMKYLPFYALPEGLPHSPHLASDEQRSALR